MKKLIPYSVCIFIFLVFVYLLIPTGVSPVDVASRYNGLYSNEYTQYTKAAFMSYRYLIQQDKGQEEEEGQITLTGGQALAEAAWAEYEYYNANYACGGERYYYWYDFIPEIDSNGVQFLEYEPVGSRQLLPKHYYYQAHMKGNSAPWCAIFVSSMGQKAGLTADGTMIRGASCVELYKMYLARGNSCYFLKSHFNYKNGRLADFQASVGDINGAMNIVDSFTPMPGDLIFMNYKRKLATCSHIGIVYSVDEEAGTVTTVEGNITTDDTRRTKADYNGDGSVDSFVGSNTFALNRDSIVGYVRLDFER